jgi:hypothetical protein
MNPVLEILKTRERVPLSAPPAGGPIDPDIQADIDKFEVMLAKLKAGEVEEDVFRVFRLNNGIYGQRQGGTAQMVRLKVPYGSVTPEQLEMMAYVADAYSRGWGHITTRQNIQFHFVELDTVPEVLRLFGSVGMTTREACGDTVRNVQGCHLAGACPFEALDITQWAEQPFDTSCATLCRNGCRASSRSISPVVRPTVVRRCSTTPVSSQPRVRCPTAPSSAASACSSPGAWVPIRILRWRSKSSPHAKTCSHARGNPAVFDQAGQPRQQAAGPHEVALRHARVRRGPTARAEDTPHVARVVVMARRPSPKKVQRFGDAPRVAPTASRRRPWAMASPR